MGASFFFGAVSTTKSSAAAHSADIHNRDELMLNGWFRSKRFGVVLAVCLATTSAVYAASPASSAGDEEGQDVSQAADRPAGSSGSGSSDAAPGVPAAKSDGDKGGQTTAPKAK